MFDKTVSPVLVTGIERSGSSIIARIINLCGAFVGNVTDTCENIKIKEFVDGYYRQIGIPINDIFKQGGRYNSSLEASLNAQYPLPDTDALLIPANWRKYILDILGNENLGSNEQWMYKSHRSAQIWPVWNYAFPNAKWIIVRRRTGDIVQSCIKTSYMSAFKSKLNQKIVKADSEQAGWLWWVRQHENIFRDMIETGLNCKVIWPERMVYGDYGQIHEMLEWIGLDWNPKIVTLVEELLQNSPQRERSKHGTRNSK